MKTKLILAGLVLPALFAACTSEELVPQDNLKVDLGDRPNLGKVTLNISDAMTRASLGDNAWNSIVFEDGKDGIGARIIDAKNTDSPITDPIQKYTITDGYASSNYQYLSAGDSWTSEALMVEGNYMFYFPYNVKNVSRDPMTVVLPTVQTVIPADAKDGFRNPIKELYTGKNPSFVGYTFLKEEGQEKKINVSMKHIFAYPQITLQNDYKVVLEGETEAVGQPITISKIVISRTNGGEFTKIGAITHSAVKDKLIDYKEVTELNEDKTPKTIEDVIGDWAKVNDEVSYSAKTADILASAGAVKVSKDTILFDGNLTIAAGKTFAFNVVLPADDYTTDKLQLEVFLSNGKMFKAKSEMAAMTFSPGKRYPREEYNFPKEGTPSPKATAGGLATVKLSGELVDAVEVGVISNIAEFENFLKGLKKNDSKLVELVNASGTVVAGEVGFVLTQNAKNQAALPITQAMVDLLTKYNIKGSIKFISEMNIEGNADVAKPLTLSNMTFNGFTTVTKGNVAIGAAVLVEATKSITVTAGNLAISKAATTNLVEVTVAGGTLDINKGNFINANNKVTATAGAVNFNAAQEVGDNFTSTPAAKKTVSIVIAAKDVDKVDVNVVIEGTLAERTTLTNNGTLTVAATKSLTIDKGTTILNNNKIACTGTLTNNGLIKMQNGDAVLGNVVGTGDIDNTILGSIGTADNNNVYAKITGTQTGKLNLASTGGFTKVILENVTWTNAMDFSSSIVKMDLINSTISGIDVSFASLTHVFLNASTLAAKVTFDAATDVLVYGACAFNGGVFLTVATDLTIGKTGTTDADKVINKAAKLTLNDVLTLNATAGTIIKNYGTVQAKTISVINVQTGSVGVWADATTTGNAANWLGISATVKP